MNTGEGGQQEAVTQTNGATPPAGAVEAAPASASPSIETVAPLAGGGPAAGSMAETPSGSNGHKRRKRHRVNKKLVAHARGVVLEAQAVNYNLLRDKLGVGLGTVKKVLQRLDKAGVTQKLGNRQRIVLLGLDGKKKATAAKAVSTTKAKTAKSKSRPKAAHASPVRHIGTAVEIELCMELAKALGPGKNSTLLESIAKKLAGPAQAAKPDPLAKFRV